MAHYTQQARFNPTKIGDRYGRLTVISDLPLLRPRISQWLCRCDCGVEKPIKTGLLRSGHTTSCGCYSKECIAAGNNRKHGGKGQRLYHIWKSMKQRCLNPKNQAYVNYGGRGILVCDEWANSYEVFSLWALGNGYTETLTLERDQVNGNYEPGNCRWIPLCDQANNTRRNVFVEYQGVRMTIAQAAIFAGKSYGLVQGRLKRGWSIERALNEPIGARRA